MSRSAVFVHGWGCDAHVWDAVLAEIPTSARVTLWDRGYFGEPGEIPEGAFSDAVIVTHSMGILQIPPAQMARASALLAVNGFVDFVPEGFESEVRNPLRAMKRQLAADASVLVRNFREAAGMDGYPFDEATIRSELLAKDLDRLMQETVDIGTLAKLSRLEFVHCADDRILHAQAVAQTQALFPAATHHFSEIGGHAAPFTLTETVVRRILALL